MAVEIGKRDSRGWNRCGFKSDLIRSALDSARALPLPPGPIDRVAYFAIHSLHNYCTESYQSAQIAPTVQQRALAKQLTTNDKYSRGCF